MRLKIEVIKTEYGRLMIIVLTRVIQSVSLKSLLLSAESQQDMILR